MSVEWTKGAWAKDVVHWVEDGVANLSVVFSWQLPQARRLAEEYVAKGYEVRAGGPGVFRAKGYLDGVATIAKPSERIPDALVRHNPMATKASEGCPVNCFFCIVPAMEGRAFTLLPEFTPRPVLTDNNLSALPADYQQHIVDRYKREEVPLLDANSGFEPKTFDEDVFERWKPINKGPWRFGSDETLERDDVERTIKMLRRRGVGSRRIQVYTMIGHEPFEVCMERIYHVIALGGEPYVQPIMKLNALEKKPWVREEFGWTESRLKQVARWANQWMWRTKAPRFEDYDGRIKNSGNYVGDLV